MSRDTRHGLGVKARSESNRMTQASEIGQILRGRSDDEILAWVQRVGGADATLEHAFLGIKEAFQSDRAAGQSALIRWDITTPIGDVVSYELEVADGECTLCRGAFGEPLVVLAPVFSRLWISARNSGAFICRHSGVPFISTHIPSAAAPLA